MKAGGEVQLRPHELEQLPPKSPREASVPVTHYGPRQAPIIDHVLEEQMGSLLGRAFFGCGNENGILGVSVYYLMEVPP